MDRPKELERALRQSIVGLTKWSGEPAMEPVFLLVQEGNYREATAALMQMVADRTVVVHRWYEHVLLRAAVAYGVDPAPLRDAQTLPDWPHLEDFGYLLDHVIDWLEDRLPDGEAERMRETHRCGEGGMVVSWIATCIAESDIEITRAEQQAIQMLRYEADIDWFKYRVAELRPHSYGTSGGIELTDEVIERVAGEAEQGYLIEQLPERSLDQGAYDWRGTSGLCGAENLCFNNDNEIEVVCDEESGHPDDHIDNERGFSWSKEAPPTSLPTRKERTRTMSTIDNLRRRRRVLWGLCAYGVAGALWYAWQAVNGVVPGFSWGQPSGFFSTRPGLILLGLVTLAVAVVAAVRAERCTDKIDRLKRSRAL